MHFNMVMMLQVSLNVVLSDDHSGLFLSHSKMARVHVCGWMEGDSTVVVGYHQIPIAFFSDANSQQLLSCSRNAGKLVSWVQTPELR